VLDCVLVGNAIELDCTLAGNANEL
jgi:hypothetical protein